ncbi:dipeptidase [Rarobacter incanus]|uniref:Acetylornithine deacetylase/succinyl-diaminopimelate desuccinylase-like protein n=1 Tax=Rarobacter incanus TaxID=153494 RepID=A0A542SMH8_9MICO|nr:dipeptidase [Rarobacter incanus]TQK75841.1 acetylornithine deacetylase/succinyl-diaminopimelate desuccinylase-like protein [Rarobacter incanus]
MSESIHNEEVSRGVDRIFPGVVETLKELVAIPSVSAPAFDQSTLLVSARRIVELLAEAGIPNSRIIQTAHSRPAIIGHRHVSDDAPTVVLYAHHDVQPVGETAAWDTDPFVATQIGDRLFGRGAADDKAGIVAHLGALRALGDDLPVNVTVFMEGEEEVGSPAMPEILDEIRHDLAADVFVVADSSNWKVGVPSLTTSLRGLVSLDVTVRVLRHAVHSGMYGGPVLDALTLLSRLIATLHDERGNIAVAGLSHSSDPRVDMPESDLRADAAVLDGVELAGSGSLTSRLWTKPAISVIGIDAPSVAHSSNTLIPAATARISVRIAPGQTPDAAEAALRAHFASNAPFGASVEVVRAENSGRPFLVDGAAPAMGVARTAFAQAWGTEPVDIGIGGSIPLVADLNELFPDATILVTGVEDPDSRAHGANESVHLGELRKVVEAEALLLLGLAGR